MSVNNPVCIRNTNLLYVYSQMDWRVRPLMTAIKAWAKSKAWQADAEAVAMVVWVTATTTTTRKRDKQTGQSKRDKGRA